MDSLSQIVLGAGICAAAAPAGRLRRALAYGAILGTLPDLDALLRFENPVDNFVFHRSASHSLLMLSFAAPLLYALAARFDAAVRADRRRWLFGFWLALITHPLLDFCTNYGTQLFWPLDKTPYGLGSVFIIDPIYTLPLLVAGAAALRARSAWQRLRWRRVLVSCLIFSHSYLAWTIFAQNWVRSRILASETIPAERLGAYAAPLTSLVYRALVREPNGYREAYISVFADQGLKPQWRHFPSADALADIAAENPDFARLQRFTHGFYKLSVDRKQRIVLSDLRMGSEPNYVFNFALATAAEDPANTNATQAIASQKIQGDRPSAQVLPWLLRRVFTPQTAMPITPGQH
ncbi:metal-dependent hydrolase [bacterium]|nr:metal-dependent hydrolase [bacterium]